MSLFCADESSDPFPQNQPGGGVLGGAENQHTIDECVDDELAILLHQVVDVPENSAADKLIVLARLPSFLESTPRCCLAQGQQNIAKAVLGLGSFVPHLDGPTSE
jgi:hypothetical protein